MNSEIEEKTERLTRMLAAEELGGVLLNAQHNFAWLSGGLSNGIDQTRDNGACFIFVRGDGKRFLIANNIEMTRLLTEEISDTDFEPIEISWQDEKASIDTIFSSATSLLPRSGEIASDLFLSPSVPVIEAQISGCRFQLTEPEIERFRQIGIDAGVVLGSIPSLISPGKTEIEVASIVRSEFLKRDLYPVVTLVGADERIEYRHPFPTRNEWKKTLLIAVCVRRYGLIASLSRMICIDAVPSELQRRTEATAVIAAKLQEATVSGVAALDLYRTAADAYSELGFPDEINKHHQGGACGYRTREWLAHPKNAAVVQPDQAFAWNPSITGTKTEVTGIVRSDRFEIITPSPGFPQILTQVNGRDYSSPGVLSLSKGAAA